MTKKCCQILPRFLQGQALAHWRSIGRPQRTYNNPMRLLQYQTALFRVRKLEKFEKPDHVHL